MVQILFLEFTKVTPRGPNKTPLHHIFPCEDFLMKSQPKEIFDLGPLRWWPYSFPYWVGCLTVMTFGISYGLFEIKLFTFFFPHINWSLSHEQKIILFLNSPIIYWNTTSFLLGRQKISRFLIFHLLSLISCSQNQCTFILPWPSVCIWLSHHSSLFMLGCCY